MSGVFKKELKTGNKSSNSILRAFSDSGIDVRRLIFWDRYLILAALKKVKNQ